MMGPAWEFLSMDEALAEREVRLTLNWREPPMSDSDWAGDWRPNWLPVVMYSGNCLFVDCDAVSASGSVTLREWEKVPEDVFTPVAPSFSHAVATWVDLLDERFYWWSADERIWSYREWSDFPEHLRRHGPL